MRTGFQGILRRHPFGMQQALLLITKHRVSCEYVGYYKAAAYLRFNATQGALPATLTIELGPKSVSNVAELLESIVHELMHVHLMELGYPLPHHGHVECYVNRSTKRLIRRGVFEIEPLLEALSAQAKLPGEVSELTHYQSA